MDESDPGDLFAFPDFAQSSRWMQPNTHPSEPFFRLTPGAPTHDCVSAEGQNTSRPLDLEGFFRLPDLLDVHHDAQEVPEPASSQEPVTTLHDAELDDIDIFDDCWQQPANRDVQAASLKTWEAFLSPDQPCEKPLFATEAGPLVFDGIIRQEKSRLSTQTNQGPVIQSGPYLSALLALSLGRGSILFTWSDDKQQFIPNLNGMRISGYSSDVLAAVERRCLETGRIVRILSVFIQSTYRTQPSPVTVALSRALDTVLSVVQTKLGDQSNKLRSVLHLQSLVQPVHKILAYFRSLLAKTSRCKHDEDILSLVFDAAEAIQSGDDVLREVMREVLAQASAPWIEFVEQWVGLKPELGISLSIEGTGKSFVQVVDNTTVDDAGFESDQREFSFDENRMPRFIPRNLAIQIFEAGRNLRLLRTHHPEHPISQPDFGSSSGPPRLRWRYLWSEVHQFQDDAHSYEHRIWASTEPSAQVVKNRSIFHESSISRPHRYQLEFFGLNESQLEARLASSMATMNQAPHLVSENSLSTLLMDRLVDTASRPTLCVEIDPHWALVPNLSFGPLVNAQGSIINRHYLNILLKQHDLREHIRVQKEFHLLGNGMFCSRLSHALFDPDLETAERQAGVAMNGGVMGLRLNGRDTWPPASSELRLALMGILVECYSGNSADSNISTEQAAELPGDISFAVRDLSSEEIDKCLDPGSLEALDFLRLSYKPPPPLLPVITTSILVKYDRIFRLGLRVLRMLYVVGQIHRDTVSRTSRWYQVDNTSFRFNFESERFVTAIASYFFETGIEMPWRKFEAWLDGMETMLSGAEVTPTQPLSVSPNDLRDEHEWTLDSIMQNLFLRKRHQPILSLLDEIFTLILRFSHRTRLEATGRVDPEDDGSYTKALYQAFRKKVDVFTTARTPGKLPATCRWTGSGAPLRGTPRRVISALETRLRETPNTSSSQSNLTLTQELERLEQSITLTLQEIDHNFSKAHRIVTTSILPLVEQYGENSKAVWEASKFWKQFFEASANVSLSGYEEAAGNGDGETTRADDETALHDEGNDTDYASQADLTVQPDADDDDDQQPDSPSHHRSQRAGAGLHDLEESLLDDATVTGSTPRPPTTKSMRGTDFADLGSPYEKLRRELQQGGGGGGRPGNDNDTVRTDLFEQGDFDNRGDGEDDETMELPAHQRRAATKLPDMSMTPDKQYSSSMLEEPTLQFGSTAKKQQQNKDPLLHRVLDKNYRLQATPLTGANAYRRASPDKFGSAMSSPRRTGGGKGGIAETPQGKNQANRQLWEDSPMSSPEMAMPKLRSDLYSMSPVKTRGLLYNKGPSGGGGGGGGSRTTAPPPPRTPGVSVQTPATGGRKTKDVFAGQAGAAKAAASKKDEITWESDSDDFDLGAGGGGFGGMSPPKTIQFALPPSKLMQTPAREASKRIVEDLLITAGAGPGGDSPELSPTMVKMNQDLLDDSF
ncbi:Spc98 family-domain-containing protein [Microdochium bolleyi]|uniref:DASH complex subunit ASK1 n=1 Tax=Microdochium bolleyi TaxID=196109 RepID=A0A136J5E3_9PEZI|nr:Spc98 family-domain-containing protein [Microdochium bolleyi]